MAINEQCRHRVLELSGKDARGVSINALLPGKRSLQLEAVAVFLLPRICKELQFRTVTPSHSIIASAAARSAVSLASHTWKLANQKFEVANPKLPR
jgi:hypothetical protein